ncbi:MAG: transcriptional regulator with XRE-family HTH domain [Polaribacter sp.]|jgi:transcriptional regulator with XRE-family HTH domain
MKEKEKEKIESCYTSILKKIAQKRAEAGLTQIDLAFKLGLTASGYFKIEKGQSKLDLERLLAILVILDISLKEFFKDFE